MLIRKFGYETKAIRWVFAFLLLMDAFIFTVLLLFAKGEDMVAIVPTLLILTIVAIVFGLSPMMTRHEVHDTYIVLRQGWYYRNRIDLTDVVAIKRVRQGPWSYGVHLIGGGVIYINGRTKDLILMELRDTVSHNGKRRRMTKVLFDTLDNEGFVKSMGRRFEGEMEHL